VAIRGINGERGLSLLFEHVPPGVDYGHRAVLPMVIVRAGGWIEPVKCPVPMVADTPTLLIRVPVGALCVIENAPVELPVETVTTSNRLLFAPMVMLCC
jgi:hypothetical protein